MDGRAFKEEPVPMVVWFFFPSFLQLFRCRCRWAKSWTCPRMGFGQASQQRKKRAKVFRENVRGYNSGAESPRLVRRQG